MIGGGLAAAFGMNMFDVPDANSGIDALVEYRTKETLMEKMIETLKTYAVRCCWSDDPEFTPNDYAGGNIDDSYGGGVEDGEAVLARNLLKTFFPGETYEIEKE